MAQALLKAQESDRTPEIAVPSAVPAAQALADQLVDAVVALIAQGDIQPGQRLRESFLETTFGVSRFPVREALRVLETQGIVVRIPHSGCRVIALDERWMREVTDARLALERLAIGDLLAQIAAGDSHGLGALEAAIARMAEAADAGDRIAFGLADLGFHRALCVAAGNGITLRLWDTLLPHVRIVRGQLDRRTADLHSLMREHADLLAEIRGGDRAAATRELGVHLLKKLNQVEETNQGRVPCQ